MDHFLLIDFLSVPTSSGVGQNRKPSGKRKPATVKLQTLQGKKKKYTFQEAFLEEEPQWRRTVGHANRSKSLTNETKPSNPQGRAFISQY